MRQNIDKLSDSDLLHYYKQERDTFYIGALYKRYAMLVYGLSFKYLRDEEQAKDAVNDIFLIILEKSPSYEITYFKTWLYTLSKNYLYRRLHQDKSASFEELKNNSENFMENEEDSTLYVQELKEENIKQALSNLNDEQRTCIELFYLSRKTYSEVAAQTGLELNKVKSCIQNGKRNMKLFLVQKS